MKRYVLIALAFLFSINVIYSQSPTDCPRVMPSGDRIFTDPAQRYQWLDKDGNPIPNAQNCDYIPNQDGRYAVQVSGISAPFRFDPKGNKPKVLKGRVLDFFLKPVADARIRVQNQTVTTDNQGEFSIPFTGTVGRRETVHCQRNGYFTAVQGFHPSSAETLYTQFILSERKTNFTFDSQKGGIFSHPGVWVNLPANGYVDESGRRFKGKVNLSYRSARPGDPHFGALMPGGDFLAINTNGQVQALQSYGFTEVILSDEGGKPLQLAPGVTSELRFLIPEGMEAKAPPTMPLWYLPESEGIWREEGTLRRVGSYYIGKVGHFTPWTWSPVHNYAMSYIKGRVLDCHSQPLAYAMVNMGDWYYGFWADSSGQYLIPVIANTDFTMTIGINTIIGRTPPQGDTLQLNDYIGIRRDWYHFFAHKTEHVNYTSVKIERYDTLSPISVSFDNGVTYQQGDTFSFPPQAPMPDSIIVRSGQDTCNVEKYRLYQINPRFLSGCTIANYDFLTDDFQFLRSGSIGVWSTERFGYVLDSVPDSLKENVHVQFDFPPPDYNDKLNRFMRLNPCYQSLGLMLDGVSRLPSVMPFSYKELYIYPMKFILQDTNIGWWEYPNNDSLSYIDDWLLLPTLEYVTLFCVSLPPNSVACRRTTSIKRLELTRGSSSSIRAATRIRSLKRLDLDLCKFKGVDTTVSTLDSVLAMPGLKILSVNQMKDLSEFPGTNCPINDSLERITIGRFSRQFYGIFPYIAHPLRITNTITRLRNLRSVTFSYCDLSDALSVIHQLPQLEYLNLTNNDLSSLPQTIQGLNGTLRTLILSHNPIPVNQRPMIQSWLPNTTIIW